jgi:cytochrome b
LGLIAFRLVWGFAGSRYAQFRSFLFKPREIVAYLASLLKAKPAHYVGHNPAGSVAVFLLLALGITAGVSGAVILRDIGGDALEELHEMAAYLMLGVVALHLIGVLVSSLLHHENLVRAMITGTKPAQPNEGIRRAHAWLGVIMLALVVGFWFAYPATDLIQPNTNVAQAEHHHDND